MEIMTWGKLVSPTEEIINQTNALLQALTPVQWAAHNATKSPPCCLPTQKQAVLISSARHFCSLSQFSSWDLFKIAPWLSLAPISYVPRLSAGPHIALDTWEQKGEVNS